VPWGIALVLILLIVAGLWPKPTPVELARVEVGALRSTVNEEGKTRIKQRYTLSAPVSGQLRRIPLKAGAEIHVGDVLALIDPVAPVPLDARARSLAEARRDTASANFEKAQSAHAYSQSELRRFEKLRAANAISAQEFDAVQWRDASAAKEEAAAQSALRQAETELAEFTATVPGLRPPTEVKSPINGRVLKVLEESSRVVSAGTPLIDVGDPSDLEIVIEVLSRDGAAIAPGAKVSLEQWGGGAPLEGRVRLVEPAAFTKVSALGVEEQRVNVIADLVAGPENRPTLGDHFRVEARIVAWESEHTLKVPSGALFRRNNDWAAFVVAGGRTELRTLKTGRSSGSETQILEGLKEGESVILYPGDRVREGQRVVPIKFN
jgi:HlyD family secretion protein